MAERTNLIALKLIKNTANTSSAISTAIYLAQRSELCESFQELSPERREIWCEKRKEEAN